VAAPWCSRLPFACCTAVFRVLQRTASCWDPQAVCFRWSACCFGPASAYNCPCRQASRTAILRVLTALMPARVPFGFSHYHDSPAEWLTTMVDRQIARFQASVTARAAEHRAQTRWWWQRRWDKLAVNFRCVCFNFRCVCWWECHCPH